jgi:hypothetical protein
VKSRTLICRSRSSFPLHCNSASCRMERPGQVDMPSFLPRSCSPKPSDLSPAHKPLFSDLHVSPSSTALAHQGDTREIQAYKTPRFLQKSATMRNWDSDSPTIPQRSLKRTSQRINDSDMPTMAPNLSTDTPASSGLSQSKYSEREKEPNGSTSTEPAHLSAPTPFTHAAEKKLLRKLDLHLIPFLALLYL